MRCEKCDNLTYKWDYMWKCPKCWNYWDMCSCKECTCN